MDHIQLEEFADYEKEMKTIDLVKANLYAILGFFPIIVFYFVPFYLIWKDKFSISYLKNVGKSASENMNGLSSSLIILIALIVGLVLHELIHGLTWSFFTKNGFKSMKFGILLKMLTPYCHCKEPLKVKQYIIGAIMPAFVLGFLPAVYSIITGNIPVMIFATVFTVAAIGDFMIINLLLNEDGNSMVLDHPSEAGCYIYRKKI
jgi:hypothetical protein